MSLLGDMFNIIESEDFNSKEIPIDEYVKKSKDILRSLHDSYYKNWSREWLSIR